LAWRFISHFPVHHLYHLITMQLSYMLVPNFNRTHNGTRRVCPAPVSLIFNLNTGGILPRYGFKIIHTPKSSPHISYCSRKFCSRRHVITSQSRRDAGIRKRLCAVSHLSILYVGRLGVIDPLHCHHRWLIHGQTVSQSEGLLQGRISS
jgi:hypothetical protein